MHGIPSLPVITGHNEVPINEIQGTALTLLLLPFKLTKMSLLFGISNNAKP